MAETCPFPIDGPTVLLQSRPEWLADSRFRAEATRFEDSSRADPRPAFRGQNHVYVVVRCLTTDLDGPQHPV